MDFSPNNPIIQLCLQGMSLDDKGQHEEAYASFMRAWNEATTDFEKFISAHYVTRHQIHVDDKLQWLEISLQFAVALNNVYAKGILPALYSNIAECYAKMGEDQLAKKHNDLSKSFDTRLTDPGPFYHGTKADLHIGDMLTAGFQSNYKPDIIMNHIYFTAAVNGAGLAAEIAAGDGIPRVYVVEPMGSFENDPNVTDKKFPGNPSRSYRSNSPLKIVGEVTDWLRLTQEELSHWRNRLAKIKADPNAEIIN